MRKLVLDTIGKLAKNMSTNLGKNMQNQTPDTSNDTSAPALERLSIGKAAEYLGVSIDTLRRWEKRGRVAALRSPGGHRYFRKEDLDNLFGKKYTRDIEQVSPTAQMPQQPATGPVEAPQEKVSPDPERKNYVVEEVAAPTPQPQPQIQQVKPKSSLTKEDKVNLDNILLEPKKSGVTTFQKIGIGAAVAFLIIDIILVLLWFSSRTLLSPVP